MSPRHRMPPGEHGLDPLLLDPTRLAIMSLLSAAQWCEFGFVRDTAQLTDPALSKQMATLAGAGYAEARKGYVGKTPRTWLRATPQGRARLTGHIQGLQTIAAQAQGAAAGHKPSGTPADTGTGTPDE
jgi:DNA-binding transcriptional ArsR family regulator